MLYFVGDCGKIVIFAIFAKFADIFSLLPFLVVACISGHISDGFGGSVTLQAYTEPDVRRTSSCWGSNNFLGLLNILLIFINK